MKRVGDELERGPPLSPEEAMQVARLMPKPSEGGLAAFFEHLSQTQVRRRGRGLEGFPLAERTHRAVPACLPLCLAKDKPAAKECMSRPSLYLPVSFFASRDILDHMQYVHTRYIQTQVQCVEGLTEQNGGPEPLFHTQNVHAMLACRWSACVSLWRSNTQTPTGECVSVAHKGRIQVACVQMRRAAYKVLLRCQSKGLG